MLRPDNASTARASQAPLPRNARPDSEGSAATAELSLDIDATELLAGSHFCTLGVAVDDTAVVEVELEVDVMSPLQVAVLDFPQSAHRGQRMEWEFSVTNISEELHTRDIWFDAYLISGEPFNGNPFSGPFSGIIAPGATLEFVNATVVPAKAPFGGPCQICTVVGDYPGAWDEGCFEFSVSP